MRALKVGDKVSFQDGHGATRQGTVKAFDLSSIKADVEVDGRTVGVDLAAILLVNGSPLRTAR